MSPKGVFIQLLLIFSLLAFAAGTPIKHPHSADVCFCKLEGALEPIIQLIDSCTETSCAGICSNFIKDSTTMHYNSTCLYSESNINDAIDEDLEIIRYQIEGIYDAFKNLFGGKGTYIYDMLDTYLEDRKDDSDFTYLQPTPTPIPTTSPSSS
ncbi:hypothetical protein GpartN1_g7522.t1 [Galdieria partita]|uniref:Uncharacterized protein n=1 Tax=Galdieria partita TaxID=83374 RepID=A0A9C7UU86_9RHOD|nr:hypothetical protein GpartN1_g7522.t1 [Galdieria partita]